MNNLLRKFLKELHKLKDANIKLNEPWDLSHSSTAACGSIGRQGGPRRCVQGPDSSRVASPRYDPLPECSAHVD